MLFGSSVVLDLPVFTWKQLVTHQAIISYISLWYFRLVAKSCSTTATSWTIARQDPLSKRFSRQEARILEWVAISFSRLWCLSKALKMSSEDISTLRKDCLIEIKVVVDGGGIQLLSRARLFVTPWTAARPLCSSPSPGVHPSSCPLNQRCCPTISSSAAPFSSCPPLLILPSVFPGIRCFSSEPAVRIRCAKYWSFSFSITPSNEYSGLISLRIDWFDLFAVQGTLKSLSSTTIWKHQFFGAQSSLWSSVTCVYWKNQSFACTDLCQQSDVFAF